MNLMEEMMEEQKPQSTPPPPPPDIVEQLADLAAAFEKLQKSVASQQKLYQNQAADLADIRQSLATLAVHMPAPKTEEDSGSDTKYNLLIAAIIGGIILASTAISWAVFRYTTADMRDTVDALLYNEVYDMSLDPTTDKDFRQKMDNQRDYINAQKAAAQQSQK